VSLYGCGYSRAERIVGVWHAGEANTWARDLASRVRPPRIAGRPPATSGACVSCLCHPRPPRGTRRAGPPPTTHRSSAASTEDLKRRCPRLAQECGFYGRMPCG
jgi:hypothetical protein